MIRIDFDTSRPDSWAHEMTTHHRWVETLRAHGVPCIGRLAISGVERGTLRFMHDGANATFEFFEPGEMAQGATLIQTHNADGVRVFKSGLNLDGEDLF